MRGTFFWLGIAVVLLGFFFIPILEVANSILNDAGISVNFINKFISLDQDNDITNGREIVYSMVIDDIIKNPLLGGGMDLFDFYYPGMNYPHNFLLQILYDGGLLLFVILVIPLYRGIKRFWVSCTHDEYAVYTALFFGSVPGAMFSGNLWQNGLLWMLFGALLSNTFVYNKNKI